MKCKATKKDETPCSLPAVYHDGTCWAHSEKNAEARRRGSSRGGRNKSVGELAMLKDKLVQLGDDVLNGAMDKGRASVAAVSVTGQLLRLWRPRSRLVSWLSLAWWRRSFA